MNVEQEPIFQQLSVLGYVEHGRHEMIECLRSVSSESSGSAEVAWVMGDWTTFLTGHSLIGFKMCVGVMAQSPRTLALFCSQRVFLTRLPKCGVVNSEGVNLVNPLGPTNMHTSKRGGSRRFLRRNLRLHR